MRSILATIIVFLILMSCKKDVKNSTDVNVLKKTNKVNILEHPLIFEDLGIKITEFSSEDLSNNNFLIKIIIQTQNNSVFQKDHFFFIHAFPYELYEDSNFLNFDTKEGVVQFDSIVFQKEINSEIYDFQEVRFGLVDKIKNERYFTRTLTDVYLKP